MFKRTPLSAGFFFFGMVGTIVFGIKLAYGTVNQTWGALMLFLSLIIFISAVISITPELPKASDLEVRNVIKELKKEVDKPKKKTTRKVTRKKATKKKTKRKVKKKK